MKQQCHISFIYLSWVIFLGGLSYLLVRERYAMAAVWVVGVPLMQWLYIRFFPSLSHLLGYGRIADHPAASPPHASVTVLFYTALGCPFCPVVKNRLLALKERMGFDFKEMDVTLKPDVLIAKGIRAVPVVEIDGRRLVGNVTSEQLADFISSSKH